MRQNFHLEHCDPKQPYQPAFHGVFEIPVPVGGKARRMLACAPSGIRESTAGILIPDENGKTADDLLDESGWCALADQEERKEKLIVFFLEPENGIWNTQEPYGAAEGDVACVTQAAARADYCLNLDGYEDPLHRKDIRKGDIPMPAWIIDDPEVPTGTGDGILQYWREACGTEPEPRQLAPEQAEYCRTVQTPLYPNQKKEAYRVCHSSIPGSSAGYDARLQRRIWKDFLYRQRRWMSCPGGDLRVTRDPVQDLGMEYHYEEFDGWMREWYVYMPEQGLDPGWGPLNAWNIFQEDDRPDELRFFSHLLDRMLERYPADPSRVFATGHSWGSLMTRMLGLGMPEQLAAIAPCPGVFFDGSLEKMTALPLPPPSRCRSGCSGAWKRVG